MPDKDYVMDVLFQPNKVIQMQIIRLDDAPTVIFGAARGIKEPTRMAKLIARSVMSLMEKPRQCLCCERQLDGVPPEGMPASWVFVYDPYEPGDIVDTNKFGAFMTCHSCDPEYSNDDLSAKLVKLTGAYEVEEHKT